MKKKILLLAMMCFVMLSAKAQSSLASSHSSGNAFYGFNNSNGASASARQNIGMTLSNVIALSFISTGSANGNVIDIPLSSVSDYTNGVTSPVQQLKIQSNKEYNITVNTNSPKFTYVGDVTPAPNVAVGEVLALKVIGNKTGGAVASEFNNISGALSSTSQNLVTNGATGGYQTFSVQYKTTPGIVFPSGIYSVAVVYTASQK